MSKLASHKCVGSEDDNSEFTPKLVEVDGVPDNEPNANDILWNESAELETPHVVPSYSINMTKECSSLNLTTSFSKNRKHNLHQSDSQIISIDLTVDCAATELSKNKAKLNSDAIVELEETNPGKSNIDDILCIDLTEDIELLAATSINTNDDDDDVDANTAYDELSETIKRSFSTDNFAKEKGDTNIMSKFKLEDNKSHKPGNNSTVDLDQTAFEMPTLVKKSIPLIYCEFCGASTSNLQDLSMHKQSQHEKHYFICFVCGEIFQDTSELMFHHKMKHYKSSIRQAELNSLHQKKINILSKYRYYCSQCGQGFDFIHLLLEHKKQLIRSKSHFLEKELKVVLNEIPNCVKMQLKNSDFGAEGTEAEAYEATDNKDILGEVIPQATSTNDDMFAMNTKKIAEDSTNDQSVSERRSEIGINDPGSSSILSFQNESVSEESCDNPVINQLKLSYDETELFLCSICGKNFKIKNDLLIHYHVRHHINAANANIKSVKQRNTNQSKFKLSKSILRTNLSQDSKISVEACANDKGTKRKTEDKTNQPPVQVMKYDRIRLQKNITDIKCEKKHKTKDSDSQAANKSANVSKKKSNKSLKYQTIPYLNNPDLKVSSEKDTKERINTDKAIITVSQENYSKPIAIKNQLEVSNLKRPQLRVKNYNDLTKRPQDISSTQVGRREINMALQRDDTVNSSQMMSVVQVVEEDKKAECNQNNYKEIFDNIIENPMDNPPNYTEELSDTNYYAENTKKFNLKSLYVKLYRENISPTQYVQHSSLEKDGFLQIDNVTKENCYQRVKAKPSSLQKLKDRFARKKGNSYQSTSRNVTKELLNKTPDLKSVVESQEKIKRTLSYEQYKQKRLLVTRPSTDIYPKDDSTEVSKVDSNYPLNIATQNLQSIPVRVTTGYTPEHMNIINEAYQKLSVYNAQRNLNEARFSDDSETDQGSSQEIIVKSLFCEACGLQTSNVEDLKDHMNHIHPGFSFKCFVCDIPCDTLDFLIQHQTKYDKSILLSAESQFLRQRKSMPNQPYPYYCSMCGMGFTLIKLVALHKSEDHKPVDKAKHCLKRNVKRSKNSKNSLKGPNKIADAHGQNKLSQDTRHISNDNLDDRIDLPVENDNEVGNKNNDGNTIPIDKTQNMMDAQEVRCPENTPDNQFLQFCELCGKKHLSLEDKQQHFHLQNFECVICRQTFEILDKLASHYDLCHAKHEVVNYEKTEIFIQKKYKYYCMFCGKGFYFINEVLSHKEVDHYVNDNTNKEHDGNNLIQAICAFTKGSNDVPEHLSLADIFKKPNTIPGLEDDVKDDDNSQGETDQVNTENNQEVPDIPVSQQNISKPKTDSFLGFLDLTNISDTDSSSNSSDLAQNMRPSTDVADIEDVSDADSNADDLVIDMEDISSVESSQKEIASYFMDVNDFLKEKPVLPTNIDEENKLEEAVLLAPTEATSVLLAKQNDLKQIFCEVCKFPFLNQEALIMHCTNNHVGTHFQCSVCGQRYEDLTSLTQHSDTCHQFENSLSTEKFTFTNKSNKNLEAVEDKSNLSNDKSKLPTSNKVKKKSIKKKVVYCQNCNQGFDYWHHYNEHRVAAVCSTKNESPFVIQVKETEGADGINDITSCDNVKVISTAVPKIKLNTCGKWVCLTCNQPFESWHQLHGHTSKGCPSIVGNNTNKEFDCSIGSSLSLVTQSSTITKEANVSTVCVRGSELAEHRPTECKTLKSTFKMVKSKSIDSKISAKQSTEKNKSFVCPVCPNKNFSSVVGLQQHSDTSLKHKAKLKRLGSSSVTTKEKPVKVEPLPGKPQDAIVVGEPSTASSKTEKKTLSARSRKRKRQRTRSRSRPRSREISKLSELRRRSITRSFENSEEYTTEIHRKNLKHRKRDSRKRSDSKEGSNMSEGYKSKKEKKNERSRENNIDDLEGIYTLNDIDKVCP